ncbi:MAG: AAA family ATPase [Acidobacteriota bacterium]
MDENHIGLTGMMASGKGEVVKVLEELGYRYTSLSDIVREEAALTGRTVTRNEMQDIGNRLRSEGGPGILGKKIREKIKGLQPGKWVIDGIRNPHEVTELRKLVSFTLLAVVSDRDLILKRLMERMRDTDIADKQQLNERLDRESGKNEPEGGQQVGKCIEISDHFIDNNGNLDELREKVLETLKIMEEKNG